MSEYVERMEVEFKTIYEQLEPLFKSGVNYVDQFYPGWWRQIDLQCFYMEDGCHCIGGQLEGMYTKFINRMHKNIGVGNGEAWGFDSTNDKIKILEHMWREEIERRLANDTLDDYIGRALDNSSMVI